MSSVKLVVALCESAKLRSLSKLYTARKTISEGLLADLAYPRMLLLGGGENHGVFETDATLIATKLWPGSKEIDDEVVERILTIFEEQRLIIRYRDSHGRDLAAFTKFRGWNKSRSTRPKYQDPPGVYHDDATWNIPVGEDAPAEPQPVTGTTSAAPAVTRPRGGGGGGRRKASDVPDTPEIRSVIDFHLAVWGTRSRAPYSSGNRAAVHRTFQKDYDVESCKLAIFLAKHGGHDWYRVHNHALEYLIRPGVIERIIEQNQGKFTLATPAAAQAAHQHGLFALLVEAGFPASHDGPSARPSTGSFSDPNLRRLRERLASRRTDQQPAAPAVSVTDHELPDLPGQLDENEGEWADA